MFLSSKWLYNFQRSHFNFWNAPFSKNSNLKIVFVTFGTTAGVPSPEIVDGFFQVNLSIFERNYRIELWQNTLGPKNNMHPSANRCLFVWQSAVICVSLAPPTGEHWTTYPFPVGVKWRRHDFSDKMNITYIPLCTKLILFVWTFICNVTLQNSRLMSFEKISREGILFLYSCDCYKLFWLL